MASRRVFRFNDVHDREAASDGVSRYGAYLRQRPAMFADWDDEVTTDPVQFTQAAWEIATGPVMEPPYADWDAGRLQSAICTSSEYDGSLIVRVQLAVPNPAQLQAIRGYTSWDRRFGAPDDDVLSRWPAMLTSTVLLTSIPTDRLYAPVDVPDAVSVRDAKASVKRLGALVEEYLVPVLEALEGRS